MLRKTINILFVFLLFNLTKNQINSAPTIGDNNISSTSTNNNNNNDGNRTTNTISAADYVSDPELDRVLAHVQNNSLTYDPGNFVSDDISLDELLRIIESTSEQNNSTTPPTPLDSVAETTITTLIESNENSTTVIPADLVNNVNPNSSSSISGHVTNDATNNNVPNSDRPPIVNEFLTDHEECPICYEKLNSKLKCVTLCEHWFHRECINRWKGSYDRFTCPICRRNLSYNSC